MGTSQKVSERLYLYDPLDRLVSVHSVQRFYSGSRIVTEIQGECKTLFFEHNAMPLAEIQQGRKVNLLATDLQTSVLNVINSVSHHPQTYSPYGHRPMGGGLQSLLGFNGERPDPVTGHYLLGGGYRAYNPVLMRFNSPDAFSPFDRGGINPYAYCSNDPVNRVDPNGRFSISGLVSPFRYLARLISRGYYKLAGKFRTASSKPLINNYDSDLFNFIEDMVLERGLNKGTAKLTSVKSKADLEIISSNPLNQYYGMEHKFILTQNNRLFLASYRYERPIYEPKHSALARWANDRAPYKEYNVVGAGVITRAKSGYQITNNSGHYKPTPEVNVLAKFKLRSLGVKATSKNYEIRTR
ncbi:RHS repeat-associated core domain-containing protein [Pseudomonas sp. NFACC07-1]|uniref:RHS repeat-associated core domain-containing protein n=1 Tax=Pseudomonas sp. NFACC07-1 TaxID=1566239 RepID=UPI0008D0CD48|nr:RHS repeat-associated core domain-containing protein [Pseudomonas sp. NFACC07-1]SEJ72378.1 RHS repeat-associated core domain-containing protein [Pseudomonas sp. NFACC07-1]